jgi:hypothetical protein
MGLALKTQAQTFVKTEKPDPKFAKLCMHFGNYYDALEEYTRLLKEDPENLTYHYNSGICHLKLNKDKSKAIPEFLWTIKQPKHDDQVWYYLGWAYMVTMQYDKAIGAFEQFQKLVPEDKNRIPASRMIEMCHNAQEAVAHPVAAELTNLGKHINTQYPEFNPYVPANETMLIFNAQRKRGYRYEDGYYPSDLYISYFKFGHYRRTKSFSSVINSPNIEKAVGLTPSGGTLFIYTMKTFERKEDLMMSKKRGKAYRPMQKVVIPEFEKVVKTSAITSPTGKHLLFVAETDSGMGGKDIFISRRLPDGSWGIPHLLDSTINTIYNEEYPYFAPDGKSFFFASEGHNSMGGYDLFRCTYDENTGTFTKPENLGYPVNTSMDDMTISLSRSMRYAYIASLRPGGYGDLDIYRVVLKDVKPLYTVVFGGVFNQDSVRMTEIVRQMNAHIDTLNIPINLEYKRLLLEEKDTAAAMAVLATKHPYVKLDVKIEVIDKKTGKTFGHYIVKEKTANYNVILPPGEFKIIFRREGYEDYIMDNVVVAERDKRNRYIVKHILLSEK